MPDAADTHGMDTPDHKRPETATAKASFDTVNLMRAKCEAATRLLEQSRAQAPPRLRP